MQKYYCSPQYARTPKPIAGAAILISQAGLLLHQAARANNFQHHFTKLEKLASELQGLVAPFEALARGLEERV